MTREPSTSMTITSAPQTSAVATRKARKAPRGARPGGVSGLVEARRSSPAPAGRPAMRPPARSGVKRARGGARSRRPLGLQLSPVAPELDVGVEVQAVGDDVLAAAVHPGVAITARQFDRLLL